MRSASEVISIERFHGAHQQGLIELILPIQQQEFGIAIDLQQQSDLLTVDDYYRRGSGDFWVALADDEVVGSIALLDIGGQQAALRKMFVRASHRGGGHGLAALLLQTLLSTAAERGLQEIFLGTTAQFLAAHRFYEKHGFQQIEPNQLPDRFPLMTIDSRFYRIQVAN